MATIEVRTQAELDEALKRTDRYLEVEIRSESGVWLELKARPASPGGAVTAYGSATVTASGSATVTAYDACAEVDIDGKPVPARVETAVAR